MTVCEVQPDYDLFTSHFLSAALRAKEVWDEKLENSLTVGEIHNNVIIYNIVYHCRYFHPSIFFHLWYSGLQMGLSLSQLSWWKRLLARRNLLQNQVQRLVRGGRQGRKIGQCYRTLRNHFGEVKGKKLLVTPWRRDESVPYMCLFKTAKTQTQPEKLKSYSQCWSQAWINRTAVWWRTFNCAKSNMRIHPLWWPLGK